MQIRRTKIIATLGPATDSDEALSGILEAGADVLRINMSHGSAQEQLARARQVRELAARLNKEVAILADLQGPKIRVEKILEWIRHTRSGDAFTLDASKYPSPGDGSKVGVTYKGLANDVSPGDVLLLDDGLITMVVVEILDSQINCVVRAGGVWVAARA